MSHPIVQAIPDVETLLGLEPEELGAKILFLLRTHPREMGYGFPGISSYNFGQLFANDQQALGFWEGQRRQEVAQAFREAFAWLEAQGLLVPAADINGQNGWRVLSRRALRFEDERDLQAFTVARTLPRDALHGSISAAVWADFMRGEFDSAVFKSMKAVEVSLRAKSGAAAEETAVKVARRAFARGTGPLTDSEAPESEQEGMAHLFAGALATMKNPQSHRDVNMDDPAEAASVIMFASYLLRVLDARAHRQPT